jgi:hypothetical protein
MTCHAVPATGDRLLLAHETSVTFSSLSSLNFNFSSLSSLNFHIKNTDSVNLCHGCLHGHDGVCLGLDLGDAVDGLHSNFEFCECQHSESIIKSIEGRGNGVKIFVALHGVEEGGEMKVERDCVCEGN